MTTEKIIKSLKRQKRVRSKIQGNAKHPRLSVFRSGKHIYGQLINDIKSVTLVSASDIELDSDKKKVNVTKTKKSAKVASASEKTPLPKSSKVNKAKLVGELLAEKAAKIKIKKVIFDRGGYKYHGRVKALAEGSRRKGLEF